MLKESIEKYKQELKEPAYLANNNKIYDQVSSKSYTNVQFRNAMTPILGSTTNPVVNEKNKHITKDNIIARYDSLSTTLTFEKVDLTTESKSGETLNVADNVGKQDENIELINSDGSYTNKQTLEQNVKNVPAVETAKVLRETYGSEIKEFLNDINSACGENLQQNTTKYVVINPMSSKLTNFVSKFMSVTKASSLNTRLSVMTQIFQGIFKYNQARQQYNKLEQEYNKASDSASKKSLHDELSKANSVVKNKMTKINRYVEMFRAILTKASENTQQDDDIDYRVQFSSKQAYIEAKRIADQKQKSSEEKKLLTSSENNVQQALESRITKNQITENNSYVDEHSEEILTSGESGLEAVALVGSGKDLTTEEIKKISDVVKKEKIRKKATINKNKAEQSEKTSDKQA
jgi:hypothetical protein